MPSLVQIMVCHLFGAKPSSEPMMAYYTPASMKLNGGYTGITLSVCPSVESCPLCIFNNTHWIHLIFAILSSNFSRCVMCNVCLQIKRNFGEFFKFVTLTLSSFDKKKSSLKKMNLNMSSAKWQSFCLSFIVLTHCCSFLLPIIPK